MRDVEGVLLFPLISSLDKKFLKYGMIPEFIEIEIVFKYD